MHDQPLSFWTLLGGNFLPSASSEQQSGGTSGAVGVSDNAPEGAPSGQ